MPPRDAQGAQAPPRRPRRARGNSIGAIAHAVAQAAPHPAPAPGAQHRPVTPPQQSSIFGPLHSAAQPIHQALHQATQSVQRAQQREPNPAPVQTPARSQLLRNIAQQGIQFSHQNHLVPDYADPITRHDLAQSALAAHHNQPFDTQKVSRAIQIGLPEAQGLANIKGTIFRRDNQDKSVLQHVIGTGATPVPLDPKKGGIQLNQSDAVRNLQGGLAKEADPVSAPALKTLGVLAIPSHEIAKGVGSLTGHPGVQNFGQLLSKAGLPRAAAAPLGFGLDVATDPTTYAGFGAGSIAEHAGAQAAEQTARRAVQAGMTESGAQTVARRAGRIAAEAAPTGRGITASFAGRELPFVRQATAAAGRTLGRGAARAPEGAKGVTSGVRDVATNVRPTMAPAGVDAGQFAAARQVARQSRATENQGLRNVETQARALQRRIGPDNYSQVIDAVEKGNVGSLPQELRQPAVWLRSQYRFAKRVRQRAGLPEGTIRDYFPHAQETPLMQGLGIQEAPAAVKPYRGGSRTLAAPGSSKTRAYRVPISEANPILAAEGKDQFSTNLPLVHLNYMSDTVKADARSNFLKNLAATGRPVKVGMSLRPGEQVYHLGYKDKAFGLRPVSEGDWAAGRLPRSGQLVALDKHTVDTATGIARPAQATNTIARGYDRFTRGFKGLATATPGFHIRNLIGDTQMAYLSQPGHRLPGNLIQAGRATRALFDQQKAIGNLGHDLAPTGKTIKIGGEAMPMENFIGLAKQHGVIQSGYVGRELSDLGGQATRKMKRVRANVGRKVQSVMQAREDLVRLSTFKHGLDTGMTPAQAADLSLETHIDYGELTSFERTVMRRIAPFYTFSARALPLHAKRLVQRPGKFATYEKAREEAALATGNDNLGKQQGNFTPWDQRQAPFLLGNQVVNASLPLNLLNELPSTNATPAQYSGELGQFALGLANPILKDPLELQMNRSAFFRRDIQNKNAPLVAAPSWVALLPQPVRDQLGIVHDLYDKRTGKKVWGWPGKVDYIAKSLPGPVNAANQVSTAGTNQRGQGPLQAALSPLTGIKTSPVDATTAQINRLYNRQATIGQQMAELRQRQKQGTPQYLALSTENRLITAQLQQLSKRRGDKTPIGQKRGRPGFNFGTAGKIKIGSGGFDFKSAH